MKVEPSEPTLTLRENVEILTVERPSWRVNERTVESNTTASALHENIAALLNFNNQTEQLDQYHELEFGTGTNPSETGCSEPVGRIVITDPSNEGDTFYMREYADEYEVNPEPRADNTVPELSEIAAYSSGGDVYNYLTLTNTIKKTSDYVLIVNISMVIGG